ncbi:hypothetical protein [Arthrobacter psychrochitiniphilus]|uniref:hypothetical protein n=1 Tax=Arthrobacter psychrochitiniphilus TaxID=291045 RepID=UPI0015C7EDAA|nr:hypothetical protein [Arthrobacter psychrochitiniphilus]
MALTHDHALVAQTDRRFRLARGNLTEDATPEPAPPVSATPESAPPAPTTPDSL